MQGRGVREAMSGIIIEAKPGNPPYVAELEDIPPNAAIVILPSDREETITNVPINTTTIGLQNPNFISVKLDPDEAVFFPTLHLKIFDLTRNDFLIDISGGPRGATLVTLNELPTSTIDVALSGAGHHDVSKVFATMFHDVVTFGSSGHHQT
jgi:hypothetical protein